MPIIIRSATSEDSKAIAALHAENWRTVYRGSLSDEFLNGPVDENRRALWEKRLSEPANNQIVLVAEENNALTGFVCVYLKEDQIWGTLIDNLHVAAAHRSKGIGTQLLSAAAKLIDSKAATSKVYLWAYEKNKDARRLYTKLTGAESKKEPILAADDNYVKAVRFVWDTPQHLLTATSQKKALEQSGFSSATIKYGLAALAATIGAIALYKYLTPSSTNTQTFKS